MERLLAIGLHVLCYALIMLSVLIFYTTAARYVREEKVPWKWCLLSLIFVPIFLVSIWYTQAEKDLPPVDWGAVDTYVGLGLSVVLWLFSFWIFSNMFAFTLGALVNRVDPLEKKYWRRNGIFFTCYLDGVPPKEEGEKEHIRAERSQGEEC